MTEKLLWRVYQAQNDGVADPELFELAMNDAASSMELKLKGPYEKAIQKYQNDYEAILFAAADGHELRRRSADIYKSYVRIMKSQSLEALDRSKFNQRISEGLPADAGSII